MILLRITGGITDHFPIRVVEWLMLIPALGMAAAFTLQPDMLAASPSFARLRSWATEDQIASILLLCGIARLVALTVNGTFHGFRYSPHLRFLASIAAGVFWSQFCLGLLLSHLQTGSPLSGPIAYGTFTLAELYNLVRSGYDMGAWARSRNHARLA